MGSKRAEIAAEQEYFDRAHQQRERKRAAEGGLADAGADRSARQALGRSSKGSPGRAGAEGPVAFGRIDDESGESLYIGKQLIMGPDGEPMVISWQTPAADPYHRASHADPMALTLKRTFECTGNRIDDFVDVTFQAAAGGTEPLLRELIRGRTGRLKDIVATIQAAQFELIRAPLEQVLVIEGGPGTGKTAIALHRVSWLLFHYAKRLAAKDVLVVGPHPTFTRYIETVLPGLGTDSVQQAAITELAPKVRLGRRDSVAVARLKGDPRMASLLEHALDARLGTAEPAERIQADGRFVTLPGADVNRAVAACRAAQGSYSDRRAMLRGKLVDLLAERGVNGSAAAVGNLLNRLWPQLTAPAFLRDLFNSRERLAGAGFTPEEVRLLHRRGADRLSAEVWSRDDLPLLDEAAQLIDGPPAQRFAHIVVDEAQDLSPMQLRSISRRSGNGSLTVVGDLAQSTGPWSRDGWQEVTSHLPAAMPVAVRPLLFGYRVPAQVHDFVRPLLAVAAPEMPAPQAVREGPAKPEIHRVDTSERAGHVVGVALAHASAGRFVGIVCPATLRGEVEEALATNGAQWSSADRGELGLSINLVSPQECKGLEFDAVVVVEPADIVASDPRGHRLLYVAMTRTTGYLDVVCAGDPLPMAAAAPRPSVVDTPPLPVSTRAHQIAAILRNDPDWESVLNEACRLLTDPQ